MAEAAKEREQLEERLKLKPKPVWDRYDEAMREEAFSFSEGYKAFLDRAKTEREAVEAIKECAQREGFAEIGQGEGRRFYAVNKEKAIALAVLGKKPLREGLRIIVSHIDSPRLDLKQNPLYEDLEMVFLRTHYYGGIKKYHWVAQPLALHGVIVRADGSKLSVKIGEEEGEPVFTCCDLLPHLARRTQEEKKLKEAIEAEKLTALAGHIPYPDEEAKERVKLQVLKLLNEKYGLVEEDFLSAELELVPAAKARDLGFDRSFVAAYGQDDRVCAYCALRAIIEAKEPEFSTLALFLDKEEIGSEGNTGAKSRFIELFVIGLFRVLGQEPSEALLKEVLFRSKALSADVTAGVDPNYKDVHELQNNARMGYGVALCKFTGAGGKYYSSDASAEYVGEIRELLNREGIAWQMTELGKVDEGGGGTVAKYLAIYGMDIIDCGTPLLSMHSPYEVASKADIYETFRAYRAFYRWGEGG
ncbi:MAG: aminopeptidase [Deltaproteobacteria bacterium]|nr:MAG: aminopeptidase [Deltaproteobacteria bacterium]RLB02468.1 MAG: aminopeptidase [Deltaproteobacteria bacterium]